MAPYGRGKQVISSSACGLYWLSFGEEFVAVAVEALAEDEELAVVAEAAVEAKLPLGERDVSELGVVGELTWLPCLARSQEARFRLCDDYPREALILVRFSCFG